MLIKKKTKVSNNFENRAPCLFVIRILSLTILLKLLCIVPALSLNQPLYRDATQKATHKNILIVVLSGHY